MTAIDVSYAPDIGDVRWSSTPVRDGEWTVCARGTLYYRRDLQRRVAAAGLALDTAQCIAALLAAVDVAGLPWLEGDYAFVAWQARERRLVAARDFGGKHPIYYTGDSSALALADELQLLARTNGIALDLATIGSVASGLWSHADATVYRGVRELRAGYVLDWRPRGAPVIRRFWEPPVHIATRRATLDDAAATLRALLEDAVRERCAPTGPTAVSLSGGWDSTAVFGTACAMGLDIHPVSISYPKGDPGREDEWIRDTAQRWGRDPSFIDVDTIPLSADWEGEAARRDGPFAHAYEHWNRALSRRARAGGATVILDGVGGDQLFQCTAIYLADLVRTGQWGALFHQLRQPPPGETRWRLLYHWGVRPNLPAGLSARLAHLRGVQPPGHYFDRYAPTWMRRDFLRAHDVMGRERAAQPRRTVASHVLAEGHAYLLYPFFPRIFGQLYGFAREEGIELRSPLMDERVVRFALARPWSDRIDGGETKRLLRRAMRDRVPAHVLAPRSHRTGITSGYFMRELRRSGWPVAERVLPNMRLAELGMVDPAIFRRGWEHVLLHEDHETAGRLFFTLQAELWMRGRTT